MKVSPLAVLRTVVGVAACAGVVVAAASVPALDLAPSRPAAESPAEATPLTSATVVCPGPELRGVEGLADRPVDVVVRAASAPESTLRTLDATLDPAGDPGTLTVATLQDASQAGAAVTGRGLAAAGPRSSGALSATATGALAPGLAAAQQWQVDSGEDRSLGSAPCGTASADAWLLAGGGQAGRQERLVLTNPSANPVTVDVTVHGTQGVVDSPNGRDLVVPAQGRATVLLDSIAPTETAPAVHVIARGGVVHAVLNDYWLDGSVPAGADDAARSAPPSREQVIPGAAVRGAAAVRVAVPGGDEAVVQVRVLTPEGPRAVPGAGVVRVAGGSTIDITLTGLPEAVYGVQVRADIPVVAGAVITRRASARAVGDLAWAPSTTPIQTVAGAPLVALRGDDPVRTVALVATGGSVSAEVVTTAADGTATSTRLEVPSDTTTSLTVTAGTSVWVHRTSGEGDLRAAVVGGVTAGGGELVTVLPLSDSRLTTTAARLLQVDP